MRYVTGNQCNLRSTGVMCSQERVCVLQAWQQSFGFSGVLQCASPEGKQEGYCIDQDGM